MKKILRNLAVLALCSLVATPAVAQFKLGKAISAAKKGVEAATLTDAQMAAYVKESVDWMDKNNPVCDDKSPYTKRLNKLTAGLTDVEGIPLNFKVYYVIDVNAFACADGSVRVFSSLMDIMSDDELLGVIGHEIGHVAKHHSKKAFKTALLTSAGKDAIASTGNTAAALTESQLGTLGESLVNAKYSQKQEGEADDYGYEFLKKHGKNPWGMAMAFEKLKQMEEEAGGSAKESYFNKMFSSHPEVDARIKKMSDRAKKDGFTKPETTPLPKKTNSKK